MVADVKSVPLLPFISNIHTAQMFYYERFFFFLLPRLCPDESVSIFEYPICCNRMACVSETSGLVLGYVLFNGVGIEKKTNWKINILNDIPPTLRTIRASTFKLISFFNEHFVL